MAIDYTKWDKTYHVSEEDVKNIAENNKKEYEEVPFGEYEVALSKFELGESKKGLPMIKGRFKILEGEYKNQIIFLNFLVTEDFQIHNANEFMRSLDTDVDVKWLGSYAKYADMIDEVFEEASANSEFALAYGENDKGFPTFEITDVFDK